MIPPSGSELDLGDSYTGVAGSSLTHIGETMKLHQKVASVSN